MFTRIPAAAATAPTEAAEKKAKMDRLETAIGLWDGARQRRADGEKLYDRHLVSAFEAAGIELGDRNPLEASVRFELQHAWQDARYECSLDHDAEVAKKKRARQPELDALKKRVEQAGQGYAQARQELHAFYAECSAQGVNW